MTLSLSFSFPTQACFTLIYRDLKCGNKNLTALRIICIMDLHIK